MRGLKKRMKFFTGRSREVAFFFTRAASVDIEKIHLRKNNKNLLFSRANVIKIIMTA